MRHSQMKQSTRAALPKCLCASPHAKLIGALDGTFPDFGHHQEREMGGLWMHPIKILDGFWLRFTDHDADNVDTWILADEYACTPCGNLFKYKSGLGHTSVSIERTQLAPESAPGIVLTYAFTNRADTPRECSAEFLARTDISPVWFSQTAGIIDAPDEGRWDGTARYFLAKDADHPWYASIASDWEPDAVKTGDHFGSQVTAGQGMSVSFQFARFVLQPLQTQRLTFYMTGSCQSESECVARLNTLRSGVDFAGEKERHIESLLSRTQLTVPDARFAEVFDWVKVNTDWLAIDAPPYGRGLAAGMPEYPWWFGCDSCYALQGALAIGEFDLCRDTLLLLAEASRRCNGDGRIPHEITTFGICANPGNTQETAHFVATVHHYYEWTGDAQTTRDLMPLLEQSIRWLEAQDDDNDLFPSGYGIIEIEGLHAEMIDTAVYTCQAYDCYAALCKILGQADEADRARTLAVRTRDAINTRMWDETEGLYCDVYAPPKFVRERQEALLKHVPQARADETRARLNARMDDCEAANERECGWLINANWIINTPMETGIAPRAKAERALARLDTDEFIGPYGMYLSGLYQSSAMTISTGVMAVAQARYGYPDRALALLEKMFSTFGMASPGTIAEMSPDYGCFVQAWTAYAAFVPVVKYFFGLQPSASEGLLRLSPCMPSAWSEASVENVRVLDGVITLRYRRETSGYTIEGEKTFGAPLVLSVPDTARIAGTEGRTLRIDDGKFSVKVRYFFVGQLGEVPRYRAEPRPAASRNL